MKPVWILIAVAGSLMAGGAGGILGSALLEPTTAPRHEIAVVPSSSVDDDLRETYQRGFDNLRGELNQLQQLIANRNESYILEKRIDELGKRIADLEKRPIETVTAADGTAPEPGGAVMRARIDEMVEESLARREEEQRRQQQERREAQMTEMRDRQKAQIVTRLVESLNLTTTQQANVDSIVANYLQQRTDVWARSAENRRNEIEFDFTAENQRIEQAAQAAIRSELLGGQLQTFNELVGDNGIHQLGGWGARMGGGAPGAVPPGRARNAGGRRGGGE